MIKRNEDAVSPVIGVILMVAITVILAAVIAAFVFTMPGTITKNNLVSATASQISADKIAITYQGGPDHDNVDALNVSINGVFEKSITDPFVGWSYTTSNGTSDQDHVIVTARFVGGNEQVILDSYV